MVEVYSQRTSEKEKQWSLFLDDLVEKLSKISSSVKARPLCWKPWKEGVFCDRTKCLGRGEYCSWGSEEDGQRFCDKCGCILDHSFTDYGAQEEIQYSSESEVMNKPIMPNEAFTLLNVINCGVPRLTEECGNWIYQKELRPNIRKIAKRLQGSVQHG